ncbi:probable ubiquitin carboxyl-terminal hydrolase MINDY-4 [Nematostella vectensis]|uniref:probable ubiquitin carboxyl-terminal hydrolase MINDY-4 n=1 Tax=Nematostella vectensis TaxID=45351 RepID=UPI002076E9CB|nr:probable ubiquitin carboxyl-terminal hydrolase MINDY-4 [Nematostella vectensis]
MSDVESLTASLVREYLSRKGLRSTLKVMDQEIPRTDNSISNRAQLAKEIHIEKLMKKNKEQAVAFRTMLEVIVQYFKEKGAPSLSTRPGAPEPALPRSAAIEHTALRSDQPALSIKQAQPSNKERKSSIEKSKKAETVVESSDKPADDSHDYSDLLKRLEKSETPARKSELSEPLGSHKSLHLNQKLGSEKQAEKPMRPKSHRSRTKSGGGLGGPVISSGLAGLGDKRIKHKRNQSSELNVTGHSFSTEKVVLDDDKASDGLFKPDDIFNKPPETFIEAKKDIPATFLQHDTLDGFQRSGIPSATTLDKLKKSSSGSTFIQKDELVFEDVDDELDQDLGQLSLGPTALSADFESKAISLEKAMALKNLIFGTATACFNSEWKQQGFGFCDLYGLEFGIVQYKGGPCGVLAVVQGFVLKHLLFQENNKSNKKILQPSSRERSRALASAITEILWQAGDSKTATVALPTGMANSNFIGAGRYKPDQLTENLVLRSFKSSESLHSFVTQQISQFEGDGRSGCILLLYSAILTRTIKKVISDMDEPTNRLMGAHGYCTQEMVNLLMTGRAASNAFDNVIELDSGGGKKMLLKGIDRQSDIGLLSLFEHYGSCQVGGNFKTPRLPIWVVCSESHFSVLFSLDKDLLTDWKRSKKFDLYYYDGLARQDEEIRLTVDTTQECPEYDEGDLVPPLELVIRTRWKKATVSWNGSDPIL